MREANEGPAIALLALTAILLVLGFFALGREDFTRMETGPGTSAKRIGFAEGPRGRAKAERPAAWRIAAKFEPLRPAKLERADPTPAAPPQKADWLRPVGGFEDSLGRSWLFLKDDRSGRVLELRLDGAATEDGRIAESSRDAYIVEIEAASYSVRRK